MGDYNLKGQGAGMHSSNSAVLTVTNTTGWSTKTIAEGADCVLSFSWSSVDNNVPTGDGTMSVVASGTVRKVVRIPQGDFTVDVTDYMGIGQNDIMVSVTDNYGNRQVVKLTVNVAELSLVSAFNGDAAYTGPIAYTYTPYGEGNKTIHLVLDGEELGPVTTDASGAQQSFTIPAQTHGAHSFRVWFEVTIGSDTVESNELYYELICDDGESSTTIIASTFAKETSVQYEPITIDYSVYTPGSMRSDVAIAVNSQAYTTANVDRSKQTFTYRPNEAGSLTITFASGNSVLAYTINVTQSEVQVHAETSGLELHLSSEGRSNSEAAADRSKWQYENISCEFSGFNWFSDGWQKDSRGYDVLRVMEDSRVTIPFKVFATDCRTTGKTIEIEFTTHQVVDYEVALISCMSNGHGFKITPQTAMLASEQSSYSTRFKDGEHIRISFVVEKSTDGRLILCYVNGIMSGSVQYSENDDFSQSTPVDISIGANGSAIDIYHIRVYDNNLNRRQIVNNWIADTVDIDDKLARYKHNDVYDAFGRIVVNKLPSDLPYLVLSANELPEQKGDVKVVSGYYVNPDDESKNFTFVGADIDVQGTSSQYYARKNYLIHFSNGVTLEDGSTVSKYAFVDGDIPIDLFCLKADVASSEGANNVELARLYDAACPYKTPAQVADDRVRQGIDGFPIVVFQNGSEGLIFIGKYNFNADKGAPEFFGFTNGDESWEALNNTSNRILWKSDDYSDDDWQNDFKARYPDTDPKYVNFAQLKEFAEWIKSTDRTAATGNSLPSLVYYETGNYDTNGNPIRVAYSNDTVAYRLAKFRNEISNYVELQSALFYYLFTELFLMVDNRAKNCFPSFIGSKAGV